MSTARFAAIAVAALLCYGLAATGPERSDLWLPVAVMLSVVALPWQIFLHRAAWLHGRWNWLAGIGDVAVISAISLVTPASAWVATVGALLVTVAIDAVTSGRLAATATAVVASIAAVFSAAAVDLPYSTIHMATLMFGAAALVATAGRMSDEQHLTLRRLGALLDGVPGIVWEADALDEHLVLVSGRVRDILGYSPLEFSQKHMTWGQLVHPDDQAALININDIDDMDWPHVREFRIKSRHGDWVWLRDVVRAERRPDGSWALRGVATDVTVQRESAERAHRFTKLVDDFSSPTLVFELLDPTTTSSLRIVRSNVAATQWSSLGPLDGFMATEVDWLARLGLIDDIAACAATGKSWTQREVPSPVERADGAIFDIEIRPLDGLAASLTFRDATDRVSSRETLRRETLHDPLTGLPNRAHLMERLRKLVLNASDDTDIALLVLDLDQFKEVNDTLGHHHGDALLRQVAARLADLRRGDDLVARLGGDEFAVLLATSGAARVASIADAIVEGVSAPLTLQGLQVQAGVSIGAARFPLDATEPDELLQRAEVAMYQAKNTRQAWTSYSAHDDKYSLRRLSLLGELPRALSNDEIRVYYQPKIDLTTGSVMGVEALVRWLHPDLGMIRPDEFIELTEVAGLINELTRKVVHQSIAQLQKWDLEGVHIDVAVNLSARNFHDAGLADYVVTELAAHSVDPSRLMLEITESEVVDDLDLAVSVLMSLDERGIRTSIDDFGTGFSSLTLLRQLPVHEIKIDRTFVGQMSSNENDAVIVRSIVNLGHDLQLEVVAEGVEDEWTLVNLRALGCDRAQGFFFKQAVPADEIPDFVRSLTAGVA